MNYIQAKSIVLNHFESLCGQAEQKELQRLLSICNGIQTKAFIADVLTNDFKGFEESCYTWNNIYYNGADNKHVIIALAKLITGQPKKVTKMKLYDVCSDYSLCSKVNEQSKKQARTNAYKWIKASINGVDVLLGYHKKYDELHYVKTDSDIDLHGACA